jgi:hypothetical protein
MQVVRIDKKGRALDHVVRVSKDYSENVIWVAHGNGGPWTITFDKTQGAIPHTTGSPYSQASYTVPQGGFVITSGGLDAKTVVGETYKYNVKRQDGVITDDPDIDVDP